MCKYYNRLAKFGGSQHFPLLPLAIVRVMPNDPDQYVGLLQSGLDPEVPVLITLIN